MPLDNTAKLADIITALQTMEGINAKADLASVVGNPATSTDTIATINSVIQGAKNTLATKMDDGSTGAEPLQTLVDRLFVGKKWASGSKNASYNTLSVNGLSFKPKIIIAISNNYPANKDTGIILYFDTPNVISSLSSSVYKSIEIFSTSRTLIVPPVTINNDGFTISNISSDLQHWIAFE